MSSSTSRRLSLRRNSNELLQHAKRLQEKYILHPYWTNTSMGKIDNISHVPDVNIAEAGCCKYLLIEVRDSGATYGQSKFVVRGDASCAHHADVLQNIQNEIDENSLTLDCKGGGRIQVDPGTRSISVYGSSQEFGEADHVKTVEILKKTYPQWTIEIMDEEY
ncbi:unnamed protein product [Rotaria sordida]|uniref:Sex-regulated protein janus-A n=1 Tax=Rotaria sordida TaxID=392033 RepID=A0A814RTL6_9BILA|nr:unnamed protein product [Rotaria sordida]CAF1137748.1 unnamed protein product [Rotaria sordida]CAF1140315.1 unnamed protein product [Rotaria sordida]CAF1160523.1 unnamed protein product [Rotaria sordida]CAF1216025.1 unnamed protein product [Rotaria sordida]